MHVGAVVELRGRKNCLPSKAFGMCVLGAVRCGRFFNQRVFISHAKINVTHVVSPFLALG